MVLQKIGRMEACSPRKNPLPAGEANLPLHRRRPFSALEPADFLTAIQNAESRGAIVTAHRLRNFAGQVSRYARIVGHTRYDVAAGLAEALTPIQYC